ncbi:hypothetical protein A0256_08005 [Mucilaginibacter sp. PAMC 26640]|nr:hypothetical protein A0256_08005 [Mucilaginibacter sp. PAMC 26640]
MAPSAAFKKSIKMDDAEFWKIIDFAFKVAGEDQEKEQKIITEKLSMYTAEQIIAYELIFSKKLIEANDFKMIAAARIIDGSVTDDGFLYFRCWLVSRGKNTFEGAMKNPDYLAQVTDRGVVADFESMLYVSTEAYKTKTGKKEEDDSFPRNVAYKTGLNYEMGGQPTAGEDWKEEDLPKLYPKLWKKFN